MVLVAPKKRTTSIHHKRRRGEHHKQSHDYHKAYWPYLPMALIVATGIFVNSYWGTVQQNVLAYATNMSVSGLLQETNEERTSRGLASLKLHSKLNSAAQAKANDMAARDYWSHNTPDGDPPWVFIDNAGYDYKTAGENLAYGFDSSTEAIAGWMASPGHKANILNTGYKEVGFGMANSGNYQGTGPQTIVVAMYASPATATAPAPTKPKPKAAAPAPKPAEEKEEEAAPAPAPKEEANATPAAPTEEETAPAEEESAPQAVAAQKVARIQLISNTTASWSAFAASAIATVAIAIFFLRHGLLLRRVWVKSEAFIHKHPFLDIALVTVATVGFVLTRSDGIIR